MIEILFFTLLYPLKGGFFFEKGDRVLSVIACAVFCYFMGLDMLIPLAWLVSIAPSVGEEMGAYIGKGQYIDKGFGKEYGIKKGIQRGIFGGAVLTAVTGYVPFIWFSLLWMPLGYVGMNMGEKFKFNGWAFSEFLIGAFCYGVPFYLMSL